MSMRHHASVSLKTHILHMQPHIYNFPYLSLKYLAPFDEHSVMSFFLLLLFVPSLNIWRQTRNPPLVKIFLKQFSENICSTRQIEKFFHMSCTCEIFDFVEFFTLCFLLFEGNLLRSLYFFLYYHQNGLTIFLTRKFHISFWQENLSFEHL